MLLGQFKQIAMSAAIEFRIEEDQKPHITSNHSEEYEYCPNCERKFFIGRLALHLKSCRPDKPLKLRSKLTHLLEDKEDTHSKKSELKFKQQTQQKGFVIEGINGEDQEEEVIFF